jgi:PKD repeat protein
VELYGAWGEQIRDVRSGVGFRYMGTLNEHFGIGTATVIDSVVVRWPSGNKDVICNPTKNTVLHIEENSAPAATADFTVSALVINQADSVDFTDTSFPCPGEWNWTVNPASGWAFTNNTTATSQNPRIIFNTAGTYDVSLTATNGNGSSATPHVATIQVQSTVGITDNTLGAISVFPNPAEDMVYLKTKQTIKEVKMVSLLGAEVAATFNKTTNSIALSHLQPGVYFLHITTSTDQTQTTRLVKR